MTLMDFTPEEIRYLLQLSAELKAKKKAGIKEHSLEGKNIVLLFEKTSTRTRCAFEVAAMRRGRVRTRRRSSNSRTARHASVSGTCTFGRA